MKEKVILNMDKSIKAAAMKKAKEQGLTLSVVLNFAAREYVDGNIRILLYNHRAAETRKKMLKSLKELGN